MQKSVEVTVSAMLAMLAALIVWWMFLR